MLNAWFSEVWLKKTDRFFFFFWLLSTNNAHLPYKLKVCSVAPVNHYQVSAVWTSCVWSYAVILSLLLRRVLRAVYHCSTQRMELLQNRQESLWQDTDRPLVRSVMSELMLGLKISVWRMRQLRHCLPPAGSWTFVPTELFLSEGFSRCSLGAAEVCRAAVWAVVNSLISLLSATEAWNRFGSLEARDRNFSQLSFALKNSYQQ